jgi:two-component system cell cycle response regulator DivK
VAKRPPTHKVLVVDHNARSRQILVQRLRRGAYNVVDAESGAGGIRKAVSEAPDVIILNLCLPGIDAIEAISWLRSNPKTRRIPILAHTISEDREGRRKALKAGAADVLIRPVSPEIFLQKIEKLV